MRRVFLEQNLGKKSKCRFPRRNQKKVVIKLGIESQKAVSTPALTQPLVISGVSVIDFCDRFNQESVNIEPGLKVKSKVTVFTATKTFDLEIKTPAVFDFIKRIFQQDDLSLITKKNNILAQMVHNIALIKIVNANSGLFFKSDVMSNMKEICGNLRSYEDFRVVRKKKNKIRIPRNGYL